MTQSELPTFSSLPSFQRMAEPPDPSQSTEQSPASQQAAAAPPPSARSAASRWLERALFAIALVCLGTYGYVSLHARVVQHEAARRFDASLAARHAALPGDAGDPRAAAGGPGGPGGPGGGGGEAPVTEAAAPAPAAPLHTGDVIGRLEVPRVGVSVMVLEGDDDDTLSQAAGHIPDTDLPGQPESNVGIAGHRDTFFRPLMNLRKGDEIRLTTDRGAYRYTVDSIRIVSPDDVAVLDPVDHPVLTLVTCYPFYFVGHAPNRFVVQAREVAGPQTPAP
jgi:sortase A